MCYRHNNIITVYSLNCLSWVFCLVTRKILKIRYKENKILLAIYSLSCDFIMVVLSIGFETNGVFYNWLLA